METDAALEPNKAPELVPARNMVLKYAFTVVPPVMFNPIRGFAAFAAVARRSPMRLFDIVAVVLDEISIPLTVELALLPSKSQILFLKTLFAVFPPIDIPLTADAPVEDSVEITLLLMFTAVPVFVHVIPVTAPPVPDETNPETVFELMFNMAGAVPEEPARIPISEPAQVIFEIELFETLFVPVPK